MMKTIALVALSALLVIPANLAAAEEAPPEVVAARSSAREHNTRVNRAEADRQQAIDRANKRYNELVIQAKERLIMDLRRTLRDAAESDRPENLLAITQQIDRLDTQIDKLKLGKQRPGKPQAEKAGSAFAAYQGQWSITWPNGHNRHIKIDKQGKVTIQSNSSGGGQGTGVGSTYQAKVIDGVLAYHDRDWNKSGRTEGRLLLLKRNDDGTVAIGYSEKNLEEADTLKTANEVWSAKLDDVFTPLGKSPADSSKTKPSGKPADDKKDNNKSAEDPRPVPEADPEPEPSEKQGEGETFFGVPLD